MYFLSIIILLASENTSHSFVSHMIKILSGIVSELKFSDDNRAHALTISKLLFLKASSDLDNPKPYHDKISQRTKNCIKPFLTTQIEKLLDPLIRYSTYQFSHSLMELLEVHLIPG